MKSRHLHKPYRSLAALGKSGSTTRVLNLSAVAAVHGQTEDYLAQPFFKSPMLNRSLVLKHRLRADDPELLDGSRGTATKVIIPLDPANLAAGGASFLVGQNAWLDLLAEVADSPETHAYDQAMLECLNGLPSFDPFLLREHLRRRDFRPADCYFAISAADREQMRRFVQVEIGKLIDLAYAGRSAGEKSTSKLVEILLAADTDERLEPLRLTLRLEGQAYRDGIFSWKGFLYYKWALTSLLQSLRPVLSEIGRLEVKDRTNPELTAFVETSRGRIQKTIQNRCRDVGQTLQAYDDAFARMVDHGDAIAFRDFLLASPGLFLELGERIGMISHIASFWRYRFPLGASLRASADDVFDLLQDFETGLSQPTMYLAA